MDFDTASTHTHTHTHRIVYPRERSRHIPPVEELEEPRFAERRVPPFKVNHLFAKNEEVVVWVKESLTHGVSY